MSGFTFKLEHQDGTPAEPATFSAAVPNWSPGDAIPLGQGKSLRVVGIRDDDADQPPALVVEDVSGRPDDQRAYRLAEVLVRFGGKRLAFDCPGPYSATSSSSWEPHVNAFGQLVWRAEARYGGTARQP